MPPKSKGKNKSSDKTKKDDTNSRGRISEGPLTEVDREYYRAQIADLERRLQKYQHKCDELEVKQRDFHIQYNDLEKEKEDIVHYLKRSCAQKEKELLELSEELAELQNTKDAERGSFERQLAQLRQEFQQSKDQLSSENTVLAGKLAALEEFQLQKEELMGNLSAMKVQLEEQKEEHRNVIYNLEKKAVLDNDRLKKEMHEHVTSVAAEFRRVSDRKMPLTTMRAIKENVSLTAQLRNLSEKSQKLMEENQALREKEKTLRRELEVLEPLLKKMTFKSVCNQKVIQQLIEKCKQQQTELKEHEKSEKQRLQLQEDHSALQQDLSNLREELATVHEESQRKRAEADRLRKGLEEEKVLRGQWETVLEETARALKQEVPEEGDSAEEALGHHTQMMHRLLAVLESTGLAGEESTLAVLLRETVTLHQHKTWMS
ncbi:cilia- and flagella-associated protein 157 [Paramormyrops kingsleyae]|uniref:Cilia- and flagella-associated protein 157 n=1 Tax=Paramormyrops kingsleyae TaxID=1676925 RepID=A0A3B3RR43_9TELE|nr:cilia- and flagella-associated protein 157-like [Paramormyrops kingsleyae]